MKRPALASLLVLALVACNEKQQETKTDQGVDAGAPGIAVGGKLGQALASAAAQTGPQKKSSGGNGDGPPENGVFDKDGADKAVPKGAAKLEVMQDGADPKVTLTAKIGDGESKRSLTILRQAAQLPPLELALVTKADKKEKGADVTPMISKVSGLTIPKDLVQGQLPKEVAEQLAKLKGSEIHFNLGNDGTMTGLTPVLAKGADPQLQIILESAMDVMLQLSVPLPKKPVGVGAMWMASERTSELGMDLLRYRLFKVESIDKDKGTAVLSIDVRQYVVGPTTNLNGQQLELERFDSQGKSKITWNPADILVTEGDLQSQTVAGFAGQKKGRMQVQLLGRIEVPDDKKK